MSYNPAPSAVVDGILAGSVQAGPGLMQVSSSGLRVVRNGVLEIVPNTTLNVAAADATNPRVDMVQWDGTTLSIVTGTPAAITTMVCPSPTAGNIPIALIFIYANGNTIRDLGYQDGTGQFNVIFAYYYARRGLYAALLSRQDSSISSALQDDPVVALPVYNPRAGLFRVQFDGSVTTAGGTVALGLFCTIALDGTAIQRAQVAQRYIEGPLASISSSSEAAVTLQYSRAQVSAGAHRWNPRLQVSTNPSTMVYRQMEIEEIL